VAVLEPLWEPGFHADSYATRKGKGTHRAVRRAQGLLREHRWHLKSDIRSYFASVDLEILLRLVAERLADTRMLELLARVLHADPRLPGLPIGNLTSQFLANVYLDGFDHWLVDELGLPGVVRYMDDFVLFHDDKAALLALRPRLAEWLWRDRGLELKPGATRINQRSHGLSFLGTRIFAGTVRLRRPNLRRSLRRIARREEQCAAGRIDQERLAACVRSSLASFEYWNTASLRRRLFTGEGLRRLQPCFCCRSNLVRRGFHLPRGTSCSPVSCE
jgi:RNA-directed DNA polymerase